MRNRPFVEPLDISQTADADRKDRLFQIVLALCYRSRSDPAADLVEEARQILEAVETVAFCTLPEREKAAP